MSRKKKAPNRVDELLDELIGENPQPEDILGESGLNGTDLSSIKQLA